MTKRTQRMIRELRELLQAPEPDDLDRMVAEAEAEAAEMLRKLPPEQRCRPGSAGLGPGPPRETTPSSTSPNRITKEPS